MITHTLEYIYSFRSNIVGSVDSVMVDIINAETIKSYTAFKISHTRNNFMFRNVELTDEEIIKKLNGFLNKITKTNFDKIFTKINAIIKSEEIIDTMMDKLFDKAIKQRSFCELYAEICAKFIKNKTELNLAKSMKDSLLRKCQNRYVEYLNEDEHKKIADKNYDEFCEYMNTKMKLLGIFQFLGELYKKEVCNIDDVSYYVELLITKFKKYSLMENSTGEQKELQENLCECLCKLLKTLNESISLFKKLYYNDLYSFSQNKVNFSARVRFMFLDLVEYFQKFEEKPKSFSNSHHSSRNDVNKSTRDNCFNNRKKGGFRGRYDKKKKYNNGRKKYFEKKNNSKKNNSHPQVSNNNETNKQTDHSIEKNNKSNKETSFSNRNNRYRNRNRNNRDRNNRDRNNKDRYKKRSGNNESGFGNSKNGYRRRNYKKSNFSQNNSYSQNSHDEEDETRNKNKFNRNNKRFDVLNSKD